MQLLVIFLEELDFKSFIRAWEPAWNEWLNEKSTSSKMQTSNHKVKIYFLSEFAGIADM